MLSWRAAAGQPTKKFEPRGAAALFAGETSCGGKADCKAAAAGGNGRAAGGSTVAVKTTTVFNATSAAGLAAAEALAKKLVAQLSDPAAASAMFAAEFPGLEVGVAGVAQEQTAVTIVVPAPQGRRPPPKHATPPAKPTRKPPPRRAPPPRKPARGPPPKRKAPPKKFTQRPPPKKPPPKRAHARG